jgi:hypothetical protein
MSDLSTLFASCRAALMFCGSKATRQAIRYAAYQASLRQDD